MRMNSAKSLDVSLVTFSSPHFAILFIHACAVINVVFKVILADSAICDKGSVEPPITHTDNTAKCSPLSMDLGGGGGVHTCHFS